MRCSTLFATFALLCLSLLSPQSVSAQCPQGNCPQYRLLTVNGNDQFIQVGNFNQNFPVISSVIGLPVNVAANTVGLAATTVGNTVRFGGNVVLAPINGDFRTYGYVRPLSNYSPYFNHYQSGGPVTVRRFGFFRVR
jgi:hypothetical protein